MCGSYVHGRSWSCQEVDKAWYHICDPMRINAHNEMEMPRMRYRLVSCPTYPISEASPPLTSQDMKYEKLEVLIADWGIQPWNGMPRLQIHGRGAPWIDPQSILKSLWVKPLMEELEGKDFLPKTQADLAQWARNHWGRREDGHEFISLMPRCLNYEVLAHQLPRKIQNLTYQKTSQLVPGGPIIWDDYNAPGIAKLARALQESSNPCDRFCKMFAEAPNAFWAERN